MSYIPYPCHWNCDHELIGETWELSFQKSHYVEIVIIAHQQTFVIKKFVDIISYTSIMIWSEMTLISTCNLATINKVKESTQDCKTLRSESWELFRLMILFDGVVTNL